MKACVYLLRFSRPLGNPHNTRGQARLYLGATDNLERRLAEHRSGRGAAITRAAVAQGIEIELLGYEKYECLEDALAAEKHYKRQRNHSRFVRRFAGVA